MRWLCLIAVLLAHCWRISYAQQGYNYDRPNRPFPPSPTTTTTPGFSGGTSGSQFPFASDRPTTPIPGITGYPSSRPQGPAFNAQGPLTGQTTKPTSTPQFPPFSRPGQAAAPSTGYQAPYQGSSSPSLQSSRGPGQQQSTGYSGTSAGYPSSEAPNFQRSSPQPSAGPGQQQPPTPGYGGYSAPGAPSFQRTSPQPPTGPGQQSTTGFSGPAAGYPASGSPSYQGTNVQQSGGRQQQPTTGYSGSASGYPASGYRETSQPFSGQGYQSTTPFPSSRPQTVPSGPSYQQPIGPSGTGYQGSAGTYGPPSQQSGPAYTPSPAYSGSGGEQRPTYPQEPSGPQRPFTSDDQRPTYPEVPSSPQRPFDVNAQEPQKPATQYSGFQGPQTPGGVAGETQRPAPTFPREQIPQDASVAFPSSAAPHQGSDDGSYDGRDYSAIPGEPGVDYPIYTEIPQTSFRCDQQQYQGYYADVEAQCQAFHVCANNRTYDFLCPNGTIFHQEYLVCVWWNQFDCNSAPSLYSVNEHIYDYTKFGRQEGPSSYPESSQGFPEQTFGGQTGQQPQGPIAAGGYPGQNLQEPQTATDAGNYNYQIGGYPSTPSANYPRPTQFPTTQQVGQAGGFPSTVQQRYPTPQPSFGPAFPPLDSTHRPDSARSQQPPYSNQPSGQGPSQQQFGQTEAPTYPGSGTTAALPSTPSRGYTGASTPQPPSREYLPPVNG